MQKYLKGSELTAVKNKQKSKLLGLSHELYVQSCEDAGTSYNLSYVTKYGTNLKQKKSQNGLDTDGGKKYLFDDEFCIEIDTESNSYKKMSASLRQKTKEGSEMESDGWNLD